MEEKEPDELDINKVERDIEEARKAAIDAGIVEDPDKPRFYESGERSDLDDQQIAP